MLQPFRLKAVCKDYLWGGRRLRDLWGKGSGLDVVAESWELSAHPAGDGTIADGPRLGQPFSAFVSDHPEAVSDRQKRDDPFPLLVKLIDAAKPLSIQVHPDDDYAARVEGGSGKTELWYVIDCDPGAFLYLGFERQTPREEMERRMRDGTLVEILHREQVQPGECFFIPAGTVHAIGAGILIAEVQQNSDLTYRVDDYGRRDFSGRLRELHLDKAIDVSRPVPADREAPGARGAVSVPGGTLQVLAETPFFRVGLLELSGVWRCVADETSFLSLLCLGGAAEFVSDSGVSSLKALRGSSIFVPATTGPFSLSGQGKFLISSLGR
ncbi:MAG: class I mannose-6-phosphate isomerase [Fretibacterium sp.]|nr:class I mannose-6-phosphate isomerase [Fretibacterium sp.]